MPIDNVNNIGTDGIGTDEETRKFYEANRQRLEEAMGVIEAHRNGLILPNPLRDRQQELKPVEGEIAPINIDVELSQRKKSKLLQIWNNIIFSKDYSTVL